MRAEQSAANRLGLDWETRVFCPRGSSYQGDLAVYTKKHLRGTRRTFTKKAYDWFKIRQEYSQWLRKVESDYDLLLVRYNVHDPFLLHFLRSTSTPTYLVHHTLEGSELKGSGGKMGHLRALADRFIGRRAIAMATGVIGVTPEICDYEQRRLPAPLDQSLVYPNGIEYDSDVCLDRRGKVVELLFVASKFSPWHGLDRLLASILKSEDDFILHLVGELRAPDLLLAEADPRVRLHGRLSEDEIQSLASACTLGLSSLALDRNGMEQACTLKVRHYLRMGLPVYASYLDVFPNSFSYYRSGPPELTEILRFAVECAEYSREDVSETARPFIEKISLLRGLAQAIQSANATTDVATNTHCENG